MTASQEMARFALFDKLSEYGAEFSGRQSVIRIATMEIKKEGRSS